MRDRGAISLIVISVVLAGLSALAAIVSVLREGLGANAAAWIQAGGSIAAIAGAVWLSRSETMRRRHEIRIAGEQVAWGVRYAIRQAQVEAGIIASEFLTEDFQKDASRIRDWLLRTTNCQGVLRIYAERLDHLHPALNFLANNAILLLRQLEEDIRSASGPEYKGKRPSVEVSKKIANYQGFFGQLLEELDARMRGVLKELEESPNLSPASRIELWKLPQEK
jgi:hypothetical protein